MLITMDPNETKEVSLPGDKEPKTIFTIGTLDARLYSKICDDTNEIEDKGIKIRYHEKYVYAVRFGLKGWSNLANKKGEQVPFNPATHLMQGEVPGVGSRQCLTDDAMAIIRPYVGALGLLILTENELTPEQSKN